MAHLKTFRVPNHGAWLMCECVAYLTYLFCRRVLLDYWMLELASMLPFARIRRRRRLNYITLQCCSA